MQLGIILARKTRLLYVSDMCVLGPMHITFLGSVAGFCQSTLKKRIPTGTMVGGIGQT